MAEKTTGLVDHRGNPIKAATLQTEVAAPSVAGVRTHLFGSVSNTLTPQRLAQVVTQVDANDINAYLTLAMEMEERDLHYHSVLSTRKLAVGELTVSVEAYSDDPLDVEQADLVTAAVNDEAFDKLLTQQLDAIGKGFSVSEIMWDSSAKQWLPDEYIWRDQRHFRFDDDTGSRLMMLDDSEPSRGVELAAYKFATHLPEIKMGLPIRGGLARLALVAYMCKGYVLKDWLAFAEVFGMPLRLGKYNPAATPQQKAELLSAVADMGTDAAAIIPDSMVIEFVEAQRSGGDGGEKLFQGFADWLDRQVSKGVLGQTMTTDDGSSQSQATVHNSVREDIRDADAKQLAATIRRDIVRPIIDLNWGPRERGRYPKVIISAEEPENLELLSKALTPFIDRGLEVEASVIRDKFKVPEPEEGAEILRPKIATGAEAGIRGTDEERAQRGEPEPQPQGRPTVDDDDQDAEDDREQQRSLTTLMRKVRRGVELTQDERTVLVALAATQPKDDEVSRLSNNAAARDWRKAMGPILDPITELAERSESPEEFLAGLHRLNLNGGSLVDVLALLMFKGRGLGDATDDVLPNRGDLRNKR